MLPVICMCGYHKKRLKLAMGKSLYYYMCPNYRIEFRSQGDEICSNHISKVSIESVKEDVEYQYNDNKLLVGYKNTLMVGKNTVSYEVLDINEDYIAVGVININRLKKKRKGNII